jgi:hypothetical protein
VSIGRGGVVPLVAGLAVIAAVGLVAPVRRPLYDGVVAQEPYRFLNPVGTELGDPTSYMGSQAVAGPQSPAFAAATAESPPQAQLIAQAGAFSIARNVAELHISITPAAPDPADSVIGNAYQFEVTGSDGAAVVIPRGSFVTLALRAPAGATDVAIVQSEGGGWQSRPMLQSGQPDLYLVNVDALGEFAIRGSMPVSTIQPNLWARVIGIAMAAAFVVVAASLLWPRRRRPPPADANPAASSHRRGWSRRGPRR